MMMTDIERLIAELDKASLIEDTLVRAEFLVHVRTQLTNLIEGELEVYAHREGLTGIELAEIYVNLRM